MYIIMCINQILWMILVPCLMLFLVETLGPSGDLDSLAVSRVWSPDVGLWPCAQTTGVTLGQAGWLVDGWWPCCGLGEFDIDLMNIKTHVDREKHFGNMSYRYWNSTGHFAVCPSCFQWHPAVERAVASQAPAWYLSRWYLKVRVWATFWSSLTDQRFMSFSPLVISLFVHKL